MLVQEFLTGAEYSVQLIGNPDQGLRALPILEVDYSRLDEKLPKILGYESKWEPDSPYWTQIKYREATLSDQKQQQMIDSSSRLFERLGCRDYARFDFRADAKGEIKLLEVNPNPGWCWDGKMNIMAGFQGMRYSELLGQILLAAVERLGITAKPAQAQRGQRQRSRGRGGVTGLLGVALCWLSSGARRACDLSATTQKALLAELAVAVPDLELPQARNDLPVALQRVADHGGARRSRTGEGRQVSR